MRRRRGGLVRGVARTAVVAGTASAVAGRVHHRQGQRWAAEEDAQYAEAEQQSAAQQAAAAPVVGGDVAELQQFADLHAQGVLTDEEFAAKKKQILGL